MASTSETGHAINFENFEDLIQVNTGFGDEYNPSNALIIIEAMTIKFNATDTIIEVVSIAKAPFTDATNVRQKVFEAMKRLTTRVVNAFKTQEETTDRQYKDAMTIVHKIRGERAGKINPEDPNTISVSQQSYDNQYNHFRDFINYIKSHSFYAPNETALQSAALIAYLASMRVANKAVTTAAVPLNKALKERDKIMYAKKTGLVDVAIESKDYVKSAFEGGSKSAEYALVKGISFRNFR